MKISVKGIVGMVLGGFFLTIVSVFATHATVSSRLIKDNNIVDNTQQPETAVVNLSASEVSRHNISTDCWMIINGETYNVTPFLSIHPGGSVIMVPYCGMDASNAFATKGKSPPSAHSQTALSLLKKYLIVKKSTAQTPEVLTKNVTGNSTVSSGGVESKNQINLSTSKIAAHSTAADCWIIINNNVYAVSSYLASHPGGVEVITNYCGRDATNVFSTKGKNPGVSHSSYANTLLKTFMIGTLGSDVAVIPTTVIVPTTTPTTPLATTNSLTSAQVATHNTASNCWLIINNNVYDVTNYLVMHPGGVVVVTPYCGKDATNAFNTKGGRGVSHSQTAKNLLDNYYIGPLSGQSTLPTATLVPGVPTPTPTLVPTTAPTPTPVAGLPTYTTAEVATHNTASNCWLIINNNVYNVTSYLNSHPGGVSVITPYCGKEATNAFNTKGGKGSSHSQSAKNLLANYLIGTIGTTQPTATTAPGAPTNTPVPPTATPIPGSVTNTPVPYVATQGVVPPSVLTLYPSATIKNQTIEDNGSQELEVNTSNGCRHIKVNSSGSVTSNQAC